MQLGHILSSPLSMCGGGYWGVEMREESRKVMSEERVENCTLKVIKMSEKLMAIGYWFPPKFPNAGTLVMHGI